MVKAEWTPKKAVVKRRLDFDFNSKEDGGQSQREVAAATVLEEEHSLTSVGGDFEVIKEGDFASTGGGRVQLLTSESKNRRMSEGGVVLANKTNYNQQEDSVEDAAEDELVEEGGDENVEENCEENAENVMPANEEDPEMLLDDEDESDAESLFDPALGYKAENIRKPLLGFSDLDERKIFPIVDHQSMILFEIVQKLENEHFKSSERVLLRHNMAEAINPVRYSRAEGGPMIRLKVVDPKAREESIIQRAVAMASTPDKVPDRILAAIAKDFFQPDKLALLQEALDKGWKREIVMRSHCSPGKKLGDVYYFSPEGHKYRSSKQVAIALTKRPDYELSIENFSFAKARVSYNPEQETVRQAYGGKSAMPANVNKTVRFENKAQSLNTSSVSMDRGNAAGDDSPLRDVELDGEDGEGKSGRGSSSRRSIQPPKRYATGENVYYGDNTKKPRGSGRQNQQKDYDDEGAMEMGMLPPKYHKGMEDTNSSGMTSEFEAGQMDLKRRGRPPKPGGKKDLLAQARARNDEGVEDYDNDSMFGISRLQQSIGYDSNAYRTDSYGIPESIAYTYSNADSDGEHPFPAEMRKRISLKMGPSGDDGLSRNAAELLPCSIRCPGMTGDIPTLQCRRCLCLYHPGCLGLPKNQTYRNFNCSNCEGEDSGRQPQQQQQQQSSNNHRGGRDQAMKLQGNEIRSNNKPPPPLIRVNPWKGSVKLENRKLVAPRMPNLQPTLAPYGSRNAGGGAGSAAAAHLRNRVEMPRLNPPPLQLLKKSEAGSRPSLSVSSVDMRSRRGRPPRNNLMIPQLNNRALTITKISLPRMGGIQAPPVPQLQPMLGPRVPLRRPNLGCMPRSSLGGQRGGLLNAQKRAMVAYPRPNLDSQSRGRMHMTQMNKFHPSMNKNNAGLVKNKTGVVSSSPMFKRYAQSVVTINQKKYIAIPKAKEKRKPVLVAELPEAAGLEEELAAAGDEEEHPDEEGVDEEDQESAYLKNLRKMLLNGEANESDEEAELDDQDEMMMIDDQLEEGEEEISGKGLEDFGEEDQVCILKNVFAHLELRDLLHCSVINESWRTVAEDKELWETIRLDGIRVVDWQKLCNVILVRETEVLDARGIIMDDLKDGWDRLSSLFMTRPRKLIVSAVLAQEEEGLDNFRHDNPNCEVQIV